MIPPSPEAVLARRRAARAAVAHDFRRREAARFARWYAANRERLLPLKAAAERARRARRTQEGDEG